MRLHPDPCSLVGRDFELIIRQVQERLVERGLALSELAEQLGIPRERLSAAISSFSPVNAQTLWAACDALGLDLAPSPRTVTELTAEFARELGRHTDVPIVLLRVLSVCALPDDFFALGDACIRQEDPSPAELSPQRALGTLLRLLGRYIYERADYSAREMLIGMIEGANRGDFANLKLEHSVEFVELLRR